MAISSGATTLTAKRFGRPVLGCAALARGVMQQAAPERLWALRDDEIGASLEVLGELHAMVQAQIVLVMAQARDRSLGSGQGWGPVDWARTKAPLLSNRDLLDADVVATAMSASASVDRSDHRLDEVFDAVTAVTSSDTGLRVEALPVGKAAQICRFHRSVRGLADPVGLGGATAELLGAARGVHGWDERTLAVAIRRTGQVARPDGAVERDAQLRRAHRSLVKGPGPVGMWRYTLVLDEEGAAVVDAAVDALAKPRRDADTGELDSRTPAARRADALLDLVSRAVSAPHGVPRQAKTSLVVTIGLDALQGRCRGAGMTMDDEALTVATVRRLACDAQVIPVVLGTQGEVLDQGMARRLFDRAQIRNLWLRDRHCTFPGCSRPAAWTDAHHLVHWADGGPADLDNAALLCRVHHSVVHTHRHGARITHDPGGTDSGSVSRRGGHGGGGGGGRLGDHSGSGRPRVEWDLTLGSYDDTVTEWRAREQARGRDRARPRPTPATD